MNDSPFKAIQDAQKIEREGWMPDPVAEKDAEIDRLKKELGEARKDAERLYLSIKDIEEPTYHELDIMKQHEALTGKPLSFG